MRTRELTKVVLTRMTHADYRKLKAAAESEGHNVSSFIRWKMREVINTRKGRPLPPYAGGTR